MAGVLGAALVWAPLVSAAPTIDTEGLRTAVTVAGIREHQQEFQDIADANGGTRVAGSSGYDDSAAYVTSRLIAAGYSVSQQPFDFAFFQELSPAELEQTAPNATTYAYGVDFLTMDYSGSTAPGDVTAAVTEVDLVLPPTGGSTSGCEASDFSGFPVGNIALIQRGTCTFADKAANAAAAGASAAIIFNEGNAPDRVDLLLGTLGAPMTTPIPVVGTTFALGDDLAGTPGLTLRIFTDTESEIRSTVNVLAETPGGRSDRVVVVGAHLDSVSAGPGINDNGSGSATILEIAEEISELGITPRNKIRFAFWGAEESGLLGSEFYVSQLSTRDIKNIQLNLNFDMLGSPNFVRFVYDGDGSATPAAGPNGSKNIEDVYLDYFGSTPTEPTAFDGRSDYGPFIAVGIPAGGLFSGAEGRKTAEQVGIYGGIAGEQYDPCYHEACDTFAGTGAGAGATPPGLGLVSLDQLSDATAHSVLVFAQTTSAVNGTDKGSAKGLHKKMEQFQFRGSHLQK
jgi:Zn-dependent M28 family amino/carboxypeptidase